MKDEFYALYPSFDSPGKIYEMTCNIDICKIYDKIKFWLTSKSLQLSPSNALWTADPLLRKTKFFTYNSCAHAKFKEVKI